MELEVRHLRLVEAITEEGTVTKAGERLHLTQSALSLQLRDIEERLGVPLFHRLGKRMVLTPAGEKVLATARQVLRELQAAEHDVRRMVAREEGMLRLAVECNTCYHWLPSLLKQYRRRFPRVEVSIEVEATQRPLEWLLQGKLDLALMTTPVRHSSLITQPLFEDEFVTVMRPDHPLARRPYLVAEDLADQTLIVFPPREESTAFRRVLRPAGVEPHRVLSVRITEAIFELVQAGVGIAVVTAWAVAPQLKTGALRGVRLTPQGIIRHWNAVMPKSPALPAHVPAFVAMLARSVIPGSRKRVRPGLLAPIFRRALPACPAASR